MSATKAAGGAPARPSSLAASEIVRLLVRVAEGAGIDVRVEPFELKQLAGKGGLCRIRGRRVVLLDASLAPSEQAAIIGQALRTVDLEGVEIPLAAARYLRTGQRPFVRLRPLARAAVRSGRPAQ